MERLDLMRMERNLYQGIKYPNFADMLVHHPYGMSTICDHARIEPQLLEDILLGKDDLLLPEACSIRRLYGCNTNFLFSPRLSILNTRKYKHWKYTCDIQALYARLKEMADSGKNEEAETYIGFARQSYKMFLYDQSGGRLTYGHYLGLKEELSHFISFSMPKPERRQPIRRSAVTRRIEA